MLARRLADLLSSASDRIFVKMDESVRNVAVIDLGSSSMKAGMTILEEDAPRYVVPSVVGRPRGSYTGKGHDSWFVGADAQNKRGILDLTYPIEGGLVRNWDDLEKLWHHLYYEQLRVTPEEHPALLVDSPINLKASRDNMGEYFFETFGVPLFYVADQSVMSLYASGRTTGVVLQSGHDMTYIVPIYQGYAITSHLTSLPFGGRHFSEFLAKLLSDRGLDIGSGSYKTEIARSIKEHVCYAAQDLHDEKHKDAESLQQNYELPDGSVISVAQERFLCAEALFIPSLLGLESVLGIHKAMNGTIMKFDHTLRHELFRNVVFAGGNTLFPNLANRMNKELINLAPKGQAVKCIAPPGGAYSSWVGGCIFALVSTFPDFAVAKSEYDEIGASIVSRKCL